MTNLPANIEIESRGLQAMTSENLRAELAKSMRITAEHLVRMAAIVRVLEERGEDMSDLSFGMLRHLRRIAYGQMMPEVVVRFQDQPLLMDRVSLLPLPDQTRLLAGENVRLVTVQDGKMDHRLVPLEAMTRDDIWQAFGKSGLRSDSEQIAVLRSRAERAPKRSKSQAVIVDMKRGGIMVDGLFISKADLIMYVQRLRKNKKAQQSS